MTCMYPPPHIACMYPPPHMAFIESLLEVSIVCTFSIVCTLIRALFTTY